MRKHKKGPLERSANTLVSICGAVHLLVGLQSLRCRGILATGIPMDLFGRLPIKFRPPMLSRIRSHENHNDHACKTKLRFRMFQ